MNKISEIVNGFRNKNEKRNIELLLQTLFPNDGSVQELEGKKGEIGVSSDGGYWKSNPEKTFVVTCNDSGMKYTLKFRLEDNFIMGSVWMFSAGTKRYRLFNTKSEEEMKEYYLGLVSEGLKEQLLYS